MGCLRSVAAMAIAVLLGAGACATVPREAVELSVTVGRDLAEVHRAHRELATRYFARMKGDVDSFIDEVYRPYTIEHAITDFELIRKIDAARTPDAEVDALTVLDVFVSEVSREIEDYKQELLVPLEKQEAAVLRAIDDAYLQLANAHSIVTGHLASVRKVHEAQTEILEKARLADLRGQFIEKTVSLSEDIAALVEKGRKHEGKVDELAETLKRRIRTSGSGNEQPEGNPHE